MGPHSFEWVYKCHLSFFQIVATLVLEQRIAIWDLHGCALEDRYYPHSLLSSWMVMSKRIASFCGQQGKTERETLAKRKVFGLRAWKHKEREPSNYNIEATKRWQENFQLVAKRLSSSMKLVTDMFILSLSCLKELIMYIYRCFVLI